MKVSQAYNKLKAGYAPVGLLFFAVPFSLLSSCLLKPFYDQDWFPLKLLVNEIKKIIITDKISWVQKQIFFIRATTSSRKESTLSKEPCFDTRIYSINLLSMSSIKFGTITKQSNKSSNTINCVLNNEPHINFIVWFQKISLPSLQRVIENTHGSWGGGGGGSGHYY